MPVDQYPTLINVIHEKGWNTTETMYGRWNLNDGLQKLLLEDTNPYSPYQPHSYSLLSFANYNHWAGIKIEDTDIENGLCTLNAIIPASVEWTPQDKGKVRVDYYFNFMPACIHSTPQTELISGAGWLSTSLEGTKLTLSANANTSDTPRNAEKEINLIAPNDTKYGTRKIKFRLKIQQAGANGSGGSGPGFAQFGFGDVISYNPLEIKLYNNKTITCLDQYMPTPIQVAIFGTGVISHSIWYENPEMEQYLILDVGHGSNTTSPIQSYILGELWYGHPTGKAIVSVTDVRGSTIDFTFTLSNRPPKPEPTPD